MNEKALEESLLNLSENLGIAYDNYINAKTSLPSIMAEIQIYEINMIPEGGWAGSNADARKTSKATAETEHLDYQWTLGQKRKLEKAVLVAENKIKFLHDMLRIFQSIIEIKKLTKGE